MVGSQQQAVLHATANNDNAAKVAKDRGLSETIQSYSRSQSYARGSQWCAAGAAASAIGTAIYAGESIGWVLATVITMMATSLWLACTTICTLYDLAKIQREHIDLLEKIINPNQRS